MSINMSGITEKKQGLYLESQLRQKSNNLDLMKFLAAWLVIVHHSFDLNGSNGEWIRVITGQQLDFGTMAVSLFFLASGIFIAKSMERTQKARKFFKARFRRVWPPLAAVVVLSIIMGACITTLPLGEYFTSSMTWRYLLNAIFVLQHNLPGVFSHNFYGSVVNGALWTLPVEVLCYVACYVIYRLGLLQKKRILGVMALYLAAAVIGFRICSMLGIGLLSAALRPVYFFLLGHVLYVYRDKVPVDFRLFLLSLAGMVVSFLLSMPVAAVWIFYPYVLVYLAFMGKQCSSRLAFGGRFSYTIYLCAFPLQQLLIYCFGGRMDVYVHMGLALVLTTAAGAVLHYAAER